MGPRTGPRPAPCPPRRRLKRTLILPIGAKLIVLLSLNRVAQHLVGFVDRLELLLGVLLVLRHVGMELARQLAEGPLDVLLVGIARHAERGVVVLEFDRHDGAGGEERASPSRSLLP